MTDKYCIAPKQSNTFWLLVQDLSIDEAAREKLRRVFVRHVEVSPGTASWEMLLETEAYLDASLLDAVAAHIREKCALTEVTLYQRVEDFARVLDAAWRDMTAYVTRRVPSVCGLLAEATHHYDADARKFCVRVGSPFAGPLFAHHRVAELFAEAAYACTGCYVDVVCDTYDRDAATAQDEATVLTRVAASLQKEIASQSTAVSKVQSAPPATKSAPASKKSGAGENRWNGQTGGNRRRKKEETAEGFLLGNNVLGDVMPISAIDNEMRSVVIEGIITAADGRAFKETYILFFDIADESEGISAKAFMHDRDAYEALLAKLKRAAEKGWMNVRVRGSVKFDTYQNDLVLMADSIREEKLPQRMDDAAPEKTRVELHAHTKMSMMDGLTPASALIETAARWGWPAVAITDHGVVQAFPEAMQTAADLRKKKTPIKILYGMEGYLVQEDYKQKFANHVILIAQNPEGLHNLYRLVSLSHMRFFHRTPRLPKEVLASLRTGILIGSACEAGELIRAIIAGRSDEELVEIASFYDYLEIQPIGNNEFLKLGDEYPDIRTDDDLRAINCKVAELADRLGKMLVATGDVHFLHPEDAIYRAIIHAGRGFDDAERQPPLYLKTTQEMLDEFAYLGEARAYAAVVENPRKIADMVEEMEPIPEEDKLYSPMIAGADQQMHDMSYERAKAMYGDPLPEVVEARLKQELVPIIGHGFSVLYLIAHKLVKKSNDDGYLVGSRGSVGSSFVATMTGITEVNPLPPHWRCPHCKYSHFIQDGSYGCGYDLPDRACPVCGTPLIKDGHDIPFAVFLGFDGDKVPDIDLNFASVYQSRAQKYTSELFGKDNAYRAGTIATVADKTAYGYVKHFYEERGKKKRGAFLSRMIKKCTGVKRTTGQHPAGVMVVPRDMDIHFFTPINRPADKRESDTVTTHFDYHSISSRLVKLDNLGHDDPTVIKMLENLTHRDPQTIPFDDPATLSIFHATEALGLTPAELGATSGTFGIPEFRTNFTRQMIDDTQPSVFSDLVRISGFSHGTDVWLGNAQELIRAGTCTIKNAISARDDIMMYLIHSGIDPLLSFKTMEKVRKGKGIEEGVVEKLRAGNIPEWYIESCQKIKYLFPRAHATAYVMMAYRIAFCKVHYPLAFYAAYFSIRADAFDADIISGGKDVVQKHLNRLTTIEHPDDKQKELIIVLQLAWEMYLRGFSVERVDLYRSDADAFIILEKSLLPPFTSLKGFGIVAARSLVEARKEGNFTSVADIKKRSAVSRTNIELLRHHGCLQGMTESDQLDLFSQLGA